nr:hypothetical protein GCM10025730_02580 [Promicromonospora thailandica]
MGQRVRLARGAFGDHACLHARGPRLEAGRRGREVGQHVVRQLLEHAGTVAGAAVRGVLEVDGVGHQPRQAGSAGTRERLPQHGGRPEHDGQVGRRKVEHPARTGLLERLRHRPFPPVGQLTERRHGAVVHSLGHVTTPPRPTPATL